MYKSALHFFFTASLALGFCASDASAQGTPAGAGSESFALLLPEISGGTQRSGNGTHDVLWSLSPGFSAEPSASESYALTGGAILDGVTVGGGAPMVFGVREQFGAAGGGEALTVFGLGFAEPGAGATAVTLGALSGGSVEVQSNTRITLDAPPGVNAFSNPLGLAPVTVTNALGSDRAERGYAYLPALIEQGPTSLAVGVLRLWVVAEPGSLCLLAYGKSVPGVALPIAPYQGALELTTGLKLLSGIALAGDGVGRFVRPLPQTPALVGLTIEFQALTVGAPGSFTNVTPVRFQP